jgi:hypothetical protein
MKSARSPFGAGADQTVFLMADALPRRKLFERQTIRRAILMDEKLLEAAVW